VIPSASSTNKTDCHDTTEILLKVALNTITLTLVHYYLWLVIREITPLRNVYKHNNCLICGQKSMALTHQGHLLI
jgi:hypothetical protein